MVNLPIVGKNVIVYFVLNFALWFFMIIWANYSQMQGNVEELSLERSRSQYKNHNKLVRLQCRKENWKVKFEKALNVLITKWVFKALEYGEPNFKIHLRYKMNKSWPSKHKKWMLNIHWILVQIYILGAWSRILRKISKSQKRVSKAICPHPLTLVEEIFDMKVQFT